MNDVITDYHKWKQQGEDLRSKAKAALEARYRELLLEAVRVSEEYKADFGGVLKPPPVVTAFRFRAGKAKKKAAVPAATPAKAVKKAPAPPKPNPRIAVIEKSIVGVKKKIEAAKANGAPTRNLDDKLYELEDSLQKLKGA